MADCKVALALNCQEYCKNVSKRTKIKVKKLSILKRNRYRKKYHWMNITY